METPYNLSRDYKKLYNIICSGKIAVGFVDYDWNRNKDIVRDVCAIKKPTENYISIGVRGVCYASVYEFELKNSGKTEDEYFIDLCKSINLEFVESDNDPIEDLKKLDRIADGE